MHVIPLKIAPIYVKHHNNTPNLIESIKSSTKNNRRNSTMKALTCVVATDAICCTLSCGKVKSISR